MQTELKIETLIEQTITRLTAESTELSREIDIVAVQSLEDWLIVEACKDYDTIELDTVLTGKARRKQVKALREKKRNIEKMIAALHDLLQTAQTSEGEKLRKKFDAEQEKYQV